MSTFGETVTRISGDLNRGTEHTARIRVAIVEAIDFHAARRFAFNTTRSSLTTSTASEYMALPTNWVEIDWIRYELAGGDTVMLEEKTGEWLDENNAGPNNVGEPVYYAIQNRELRLWPTPDGSYSLLLYYHCLLPEVSASAADSATNAWLTEGFQVVYNHAMADLLETYIGGEESFETAARHRLREQQAVRELERRADREQSTGMIKPSW